ncbi:MAG TPA: carbohydrate binding domain-containing protein, partial [Draconibacterium sp.]|nr:carbohydrate binding domain-containing protein [Draconibacterium sp.]
MKKVYLNIAVLLISMFSSAQDRTKWFEFYLPWNDSSKTVTDMSAYLDAPAGKHGFLQVTPDGHFRFENKTETERFVGVVNVAIANFPTKTEANIIAARMAKFGINLVRIHLMDVEGNYGLFQNSSQNTLQISPDRLDKMDYFIKCLKDRGIYFNFCIHAGRIYKTGDGIDSPVKNDQSKYVTLFNKKIIDLQKDFAQKIIGHVNPYTKLTYADDPAMANLELTNENSMFLGWLSWQGDYIFGETTGGIGPFYSAELDTKFNNWLATKYKNDSLLSEAWKGEGSGAVSELVKNGSFEQNLTNWSTWINTPSVQGTFTIDNTVAKDGSKSLKATVTKTGDYGWYFQMKTNNFAVKENSSYKLSFYARGDVEKELYMDIMENETWKYVAGPAFTTTKDWKRYDIFFTSSFQSNKVIVQFNFGKQTGTFWLDSVSITETFGIGLEQGESLTAKNIKRVKNSEIGKYTKQRVGDNAEFYFDIEKSYTEELSGFLKNDLNVKCPVTFTNNYFGLASVYAQSQADYIDFHMYWDHPNYPNGWSNINFTLNNKSILLNPEGSTINKMPLTKVKNIPHVLSEYNHAYPYIFQTEAPSLLFAYGS